MRWYAISNMWNVYLRQCGLDHHLREIWVLKWFARLNIKPLRGATRKTLHPENRAAHNA